MSQTVRTLAFIALAGISALIAWATQQSYKPVDLDAFSDVGEEFYSEFEDPNTASAMQVASYNEETGKTDIFKVEFKDGLWRIPSHHNYPADGGDRLAKTAASMVGVKRKALIERVKAAHKRYGLLDPISQETTGTEGRGDRITLYKNDQTLVDFIVGNKVEGEEETFYVRRADEDRFYTADLGQLDISTKFGDWISSDILDVNKNKIKELIIDRYQIDEAKGTLVKGDRLVLDRESATADWNLDGLDETKEKLKASDINALLTALDDLEIVGVRPKPDGISADLKANEGISVDSFEMMQLQESGFFIDPRQGRIFSNEGEVLVGTDEGALYVLRFGEEFSGTDIELEVGSEKKKEEPKKDETADQSDAEAEEDVPTDGLKKSRFLFVTAQFDKALLGDAPVEPVKPEPPAKNEGAAPEETKTDEAASNEKTPEEKTEATDEKAPADAAEKPEDSETKLQKEYEVALTKYEDELAVYNIKKREYDEKMESGQKQVKELNRRFADWFYVISADVFDRMKLNRADLVEKVEAPAAEAAPVNTPAVNPLSTTPPAEMKTEEKTSAKPETKKPSEANAKQSDAEKPEPKTEEADKPKEPANSPAPKTEKPPEVKPEDKKAETANTEAPKEVVEESTPPAN